MSDRKYRQRGYQDEPRERGPRRDQTGPGDRGPRSNTEPRAPGRPLQSASGPKTPNLMASHEVFRCTRCGTLLALPVELDGRCAKCGVALHSCISCVSFDTGSRWECAHPDLQARVSPKDERNACALFAPRTTIERQTSTAGPTSARQAFDDLFK